MRPTTKITVLGIRLAVIVLLGYWVTLFAGTHWPGAAAATRQVSDKWLHFGGFFVLALLLCYGTQSRRPYRRFVWIAVVIAVYAAVDEWTQRFVPRRVPDFADWSADLWGAISAIAIYALVRFVWIDLRGRGRNRDAPSPKGREAT